ncbi:hypothetical protein HDV01_002948 [Terramyces sp. JEL0728]|nr:hypothetical protein HDV01_002948 [Terramyces sp. JEL0728]
MAIKFLLLVSRQGKIRLTKWFTSDWSIKEKTKAVKDVSTTVLQRKTKMCNVLEFKEFKVVYRRYASLFFIAGTDIDENELLALEVIHRYVEVLDKWFMNVCELDIIFNFQQAYAIIDEANYKRFSGPENNFPKMTEAIVTLAEERHLSQILHLSKINNKNNLTPEQQSEGFTTAEYTLEFIQKLHSETPAVVSLHNDQVVGYVIAVPKHLAAHHPLLEDMVNQIDQNKYKDFKNMDYIVVGQLCVAKEFRGMGLVPKMYTHLKNEYQKSNCAVTDIDQRNIRSKKAHLKSGWKVFGEITYSGITFELIIQEFQ